MCIGAQNIDSITHLRGYVANISHIYRYVLFNRNFSGLQPRQVFQARQHSRDRLRIHHQYSYITNQGVEMMTKRVEKFSCTNLCAWNEYIFFDIKIEITIAKVT